MFHDHGGFRVGHFTVDVPALPGVRLRGNARPHNRRQPRPMEISRHSGGHYPLRFPCVRFSTSACPDAAGSWPGVNDGEKIPLEPASSTISGMMGLADKIRRQVAHPMPQTSWKRQPAFGEIGMAVANRRHKCGVHWSGLIQRRPGKREKSASPLWSSAWCSTASAASWASVVRLPPEPRCAR